MDSMSTEVDEDMDDFQEYSGEVPWQELLLRWDEFLHDIFRELIKTLY